MSAANADRVLMMDVTRLMLLLALAPVAGLAGSVWLKPVPESAGSWRDWTDIPSDKFFEVPASRLAAAEFSLARAPYVVQDHADVAYFGHKNFACELPAKPYLVRAYYVNGGTGNFGLSWAGPALVVSHASLGPGGPPSRSALIACLFMEPADVFSSVSGAL